MLFMKLGNLLRFEISCDIRIDGSRYTHVAELKRSIVERGWLDDSTITIVDGVITEGLIRRQALIELLNEGRIHGDFMVGVEIFRTMLFPTILPVMQPPNK